MDGSADVLEMLRRFLSPSFDVETVNDPFRALKLIHESIAPFAAIVSAGQLRCMDGLAFLQRTRESSPHTGRVLLTAAPDTETAIQAVNSGAVFRYLSKPCRPETLLAAVVAAAEHFRSIETERILMEQTVRGTVAALTSLLAIASPPAHARGMRLRSYVGPLSELLEVPDVWDIEVAAVLSQLGCVSLPASLVERMHCGQPLDPAEQRMVDALALGAVSIIEQIPRLAPVREILRYQDAHFDGSSAIQPSRTGRRIPMGSRILKAAGDLDSLLAAGMPVALALGNLGSPAGHYDPDVLAALHDKFGPGAEIGVQRVRLRHLQAGMVFAADVKGPRGLLLAARGQEVGPVLINRLRFVWDTAILDVEVSVCTQGEYRDRVS